ncbi:MAG: ImmA/IrrE family metallo-endopeptidase [Alphaproteobacteria bacterium]|nr:ImmA/IrrE family metallo-endopeptidase [Alphaproteobacteria bacterium]
MSIGELDPKEVGERLRLARESADITQVEAAAHIGAARTTIVAIEKGQRKVRIEEIQGLAQLYRTTVNALLRREAVHVDIVPRFRKLVTSTDRATEAAAHLLTRLVQAEIELENILGVTRLRNYPPERPLLPGDVRAQAESDAAELRNWLGLGSAPVREILTLLELEIGMRVYIRPLDASVSGLFSYEEQIGACMLLNANHPPERRHQTAAHELGHFLSTRRTPEVLHFGVPGNSREERYADTFGRNFLTPARAVMTRFREVTAGSDRLTRRHIVVMAYSFGVSREAMVRRLEELGLTKAGTWDWFQANGGITDLQARQVLGDLFDAGVSVTNGANPMSFRLNLLAAEVRRRELLSEGQLARLLGVDRLTLRELLDSIETEGSEADEMPKLPV